MRILPIALVASLGLTACVCTPPPVATPQNEPSKEAAQTPDGTLLEGDATLTQVDGNYEVHGPQNLAGELTYDSGQWRLDATLQFPTAGYTVRPVEATVLKRLPEEVHIQIAYQPPPTDALVAQMITHEPVLWEGTVSKDATFKIQVERIPPTTAAETEPQEGP